MRLPDEKFSDLVEAYDQAERHSVGLYEVATLAYAYGYRAHVKHVESYPLGQQLKESEAMLADAEATAQKQQEEIRRLRSRLDWADALLEPLRAEIARLDAKRSDPVGEAGS